MAVASPVAAISYSPSSSVNSNDPISYQLLTRLHEEPHASQRTLAREMGVSLGKLNYCLKALVDKGWVKAGNFYRNPKKIRYAYLLTPHGMEAKARLAARFLKYKMAEYDTLRQEIEQLQHEVAHTQPFLLTHLGGEKTVTGSCHLLQANGLAIMVDCGLAQGNDAVLPMDQWPISPSEINYLFLTHAHLDHIGRLPELIQKGFKGEIITTHATKALLAPMLADAMSFQDMSKPTKAKILAQINDLSWGFEYQKQFDLKKNLLFTLGHAGHILGSAWVHIESKEPPFGIVFSGDLGPTNTPILPDPDIPPPCDLLLLESTYGDRLHEDRADRILHLGEILTRALSDNGKVYIPAFALGRTQELLFEIDRLSTDPELRQQFPILHSKNLPVVVDSPLGLTLTETYKKLHQFWDKESTALLSSGDQPLDFPGLYSARDHRDHQRLLRMDGPAIIIAGSGMCTGGRIISHLTTGLEDPKNDLLFVGYQAANTPGRAIQKHATHPNGYVFL